ncbi:CvpA family protein [Phenylobacterium soli]|uniref:CvpA family protein n=1 Tax=Phenylobacterium soli TaxID=2170551 RepID=A0A328AQI8_9CAUL|nr:CvpA family protein [Phenylobacterium soli]RAK55178.1 CvpA family protein [Phenylobacterium soli]
MTQFDLIVAVLLLISAGVGWLRGAVREVAAMIALVAAAFLAIFGLPSTAPLARHLIHTQWLAATAALIGVFLVTYGLLRLIGAGIAQRVQKTHVLGLLDRTLGLGIGLVRGLVVLGGLYLMFNAATPKDLRPHWITGSATWPVAEHMGGLMTELAPRGLDLAGRLKPAFERAVKDGSRDRNASTGYDARQRGEIDDLVEKSR